MECGTRLICNLSVCVAPCRKQKITLQKRLVFCSATRQGEDRAALGVTGVVGRAPWSGMWWALSPWAGLLHRSYGAGAGAGALTQGANPSPHSGSLGHAGVPAASAPLRTSPTGLVLQRRIRAATALSRCSHGLSGHRERWQRRRILGPHHAMSAPILIISLEADNGFQELCSLSAR